MRYKWKPTKAQKREFAERMATDRHTEKHTTDAKSKEPKKGVQLQSLITKQRGANTYPPKANLKQRLSC